MNAILVLSWVKIKSWSLGFNFIKRTLNNFRIGWTFLLIINHQSSLAKLSTRQGPFTSHCQHWQSSSQVHLWFISCHQLHLYRWFICVITKCTFWVHQQWQQEVWMLKIVHSVFSSEPRHTNCLQVFWLYDI